MAKHPIDAFIEFAKEHGFHDELDIPTLGKLREYCDQIVIREESKSPCLSI